MVRELGSFPGQWGVAASPIKSTATSPPELRRRGNVLARRLGQGNGKNPSGRQALEPRGRMVHAVVIEAAGRRELVLSANPA